jgi:hypothetical protein
LNAAGRVTGQQTAGTLPFVASHLDSPNYPEPAPPSATYAGTTVTSGSQILCPGQYTGQISVSSGATAILFPGVYQVQSGGVSVQGTLRSMTAADLPVTACGTTLNPGADLGAIVEVRPANFSGQTTCNKNQFSAGASSTVTLSPSPKYFNIAIYIETYPSWQSICTTAPLGTQVVALSNGACYNISGATYAPADNITMGTSTTACSTALGQVIAWSLSVTGTGTLTVNFSPNQQPYMKGLTQ